MRSATKLSTLLAGAVLALAVPAGPAAASSTLSDTGTGLAVTGDSAPDWVEVWSQESVVVASEGQPVPADCGPYPAAWGGCDLWGSGGRTLDIALGEGDNILELMSQPAEVGQASVTSGSGDDVVDLHGEGVEPAPIAGVSTGAGDDLIDARNGASDMIDCGPGAHDTVYTDAAPALTGCEHVIDASAAGARATRVSWQEGSGSTVYTNHHFVHAVPMGGSVASTRCRTSVTGWQPCGAGQNVGPSGGFPESPNAYPAAALGRGGDGALGLIDPASERFFVFDYTAPGRPFLTSALTPVADGLDVGSWPIGGPDGLDRLCALDGGTARACNATWRPIAAGDHILVAWLRDRAGNLSAPLMLRWHVAPPGGGTQAPGTPVTPAAGAARPAAPGKPIKARRGRLSVPVTCTAAAGCRAMTYTLRFKAGHKTVKVRTSLKALVPDANARLTFRLSKRQAKRLQHRTVKATIRAPGIAPVRLRLRG